MSRPGPVVVPDGRPDRWSSASSLPRVRPSRTPRETGGWGPHPDAGLHRPTVGPAPAAVPGPPVLAPVALAPAPVPPAPVSPAALSPATEPPTVAAPSLLPALVPHDDRPLGFVERVTAMLRRWNGCQGRHRHGRSRHGWSMFAPHPGARRRRIRL